MPRRLFAEFRDDSGILYQLNIWDANFTGTATEFTLGAEGFTLDYHADGDGTHQPLVASTCEFTMLEQSTDDDSFLDDLVDSVDGDITLAIVRNNDGDKFWTGQIGAEQVTRQDIHNPAPVHIRAQCGLGMLHDKLFTDDDGTPYSGFSQLSHILTKALDVPTKHFYGTSTIDSWLVIFEDFISTDHDASVTCALSSTLTNNATWTKPNESGDARFYTCADVLRSLALTFNARIFQSNGRWIFMPIGAYRFNTSNKALTAFRKTGFIGSDTKLGTTLDLTRSTGQNLKRLRGWSQSFMRPLKSVTRTQDFQGNVPLVYDYYIPSADLPITLSDQDRVYPSGTRIRMQGTLRYENPAGSATGSNQLRRFRIKLTIKCGTRYLNRPISFSGTAVDFHSVTGAGVDYTPHTLGAAEWTTNDTDAYNIITTTYDGNAEQTIELPFNFVTPELPAEEDHLDITINAFKVTHAGVSTSANPDTTGYIVRADLEDGGGSGDNVRWKATADTTSTEDLDQGVTLLGGVISVGSRGVLEVLNTNVYSPSDNWVSQSQQVSEAINKLGVAEVLRYRNTARSVQQGMVRGSVLHFYETLSTLSQYHVLQSMRYSARRMETDVVMFYNFYDTTANVTEEVSEPKDTRPPVVVDTTAGNASNADLGRSVTTGINTGLADVQADVETNTTAIAANSADIATIQSDVANAAASISSNDTDIDDIQKIIKGDGGTDLGILSDTGDNTAAALLVQSTSAKIQGGNNTNVTATQTSPGTIELNVQAGSTGNEAQVTGLRVTGSSSVNTKATIAILGGDFRVSSPTQFNVGANVAFQDSTTFNSSTSGISHDDLDNKPPLYHGILLDGAGTGELIGTGSISFAVGDILANTGSGQEGVYQCTTATTISRDASESGATANWVASVTNFEKIAAKGDLTLADLDPSSGSDQFSDSLHTFSITTTAGLTLTGGAGIILIGTTTAIGNVTSTGTITGGNLTTAGALTASGLSYPTSDGTNGQALTTDGSGNLAFTTISGGGGSGGGSGGHMTETPLVGFTGRVQWTTSNAGKRMQFGNTSYGLLNWYIHSQIVNGGAQTYNASDAVDTYTTTIANYYIFNASYPLPSDSKQVRVKFSGRFQNIGTGSVGFSVWHCASMTSGGYAFDTIRLIAKSADITPGTSSINVWTSEFTAPTAYSGGRIMVCAEHRSGTLSTTAYCYANVGIFLV